MRRWSHSGRAAWSVKGLACLLAALGAPQAGAQTESAQPAIVEIRVENAGAGRIDESFVLTHVRARTGQPLDREAVNRDVRALMQTGRLSSAAVHVEPATGGVRLILSVAGKYRLCEPIRFDGVHAFRESKVRGWLGFEVGDFFDDPAVGAKVQTLLKEYREEFYPDADVRWKIEEVDRPAGLARLRVTVDEGRRSKVRTFTVTGNRAVSSRVLGKVVKQRPWYNPLRWIKGRRFDPDELTEIRHALRAEYLRRGFLDARVAEAALERDARGNVTALFAVEEGPQYRFGGVSLGGVKVFPESSVQEMIRVRPGATASAADIEETARAVRDFYGSRGYIQTAVRPVVTPDATNRTASVRFEVDEGELVRIRNIYVRGNTRTRDKVVRRELLVFPGEVYDEVRVNRSEKRVRNLGFFSSVRGYDEKTALPEERDLVFEVEEKRTGQFMIGAGFSSVDQIIGFAELSQGNFDIKGWPYFTGAGQKLKLRGQFGSRRERYELSFVEPWFLDRKLSLGLDLYRSVDDFDDFDVQRTGAAVSLGWSLPGPNRIKFRYEIEGMVVRDVADTNRYVFADDPAMEYYFTREEDAIESTLIVAVTHDTRDNPFVPTRGNRAEISGRISGGPLGFDTDVYGGGLRTHHYVPLWFGHVLGFRSRYDVVDEYGSEEMMPISERLFLGGGRTVRGFDYRDVGPKVIREATRAGATTYVRDRPVGGRSLLLAGAEYTIPIVEALRLAAFYDTGNVWWDPFELHLDDLASSAGVGLRLDIPGFPIRVDRAWAIEPDDAYTDEDAWVIWIGYDY